MRRVPYWFAAALLAGGFSGYLQAAEADGAANATQRVETLEQRLARLERMVNSQSLLDMLERIDTLQREVALLRGQLEEQQHTLEGIKSRQRELYMDVDRRISQMEREGSAVAPTASTGPSLTGTGSGDVSAPPLTAAGSDAPLVTGDNVAATPTKSSEEGEAADPAQQERDAYQAAFDMLRELRYAQATTAFREFLQKYPKGRYAHIAQYWLGEAGYAQRDFRAAISDYNALLVNYPNSPKLPEAMLKMGYSHYELKEYDAAKQVLNDLIQQYPDSTEASQARNLLKRINKNAG
jgi:tol-pal system protein YbgF